MKHTNQTPSSLQPIVLTREQYLVLAKTVYLGNWMANAHRTGSPEDPHMTEYDEITDYVFSLAPQFGFPKNLEHHIECGPDHSETTEVSRLHEEHDSDTFWDELPEVLGERDFYNTYSEADWDKMTREERFEKMQECMIKWENEFDEYGVERLVIKEQ